MILGYKRPLDRSDNYWFTTPNEGARKFIRVVAGTAVPVFDRMLGAVIVIGETYRPTGPMTLTALGCATGDWNAVENMMVQFRKDLKYDHVIVDKEEVRPIIWRMRSLRYGLNEIPLITYAAPYYSVTEVGRTRVDEMLKEGRLMIPDDIRREMEIEPAMGALALRCAVCWMQDCRATYQPLHERRSRQVSPLGLDGL